MKAYGYNQRDLGYDCPCCYDTSEQSYRKAAKKRARRKAKEEIKKWNLETI